MPDVAARTATPSLHEGEIAVVGDVVEPTRARLIAAAADVFAEKGYEGAGVQEIARRAGLTTGAIYSRFSGKAELLAEAIAAESGEQLDELFAVGELTADAAALIGMVGKQLPARPVTRKQFLLLEAFVAARRDPELAAILVEHVGGVRDRVTRLIELAQRAGNVDDATDARALAHFCQAVALGFLVYEVLDVPAPEPAAWDGLIDRLVGALTASDPNDTTDPTHPSNQGDTQP
jgi:AcrR family transcriptional regulator